MVSCILDLVYFTYSTFRVPKFVLENAVEAVGQISVLHFEFGIFLLLLV